MKLLCAILALMNLSIWINYCHLDRRFMNHVQGEILTHSAQAEAITNHGEAMRVIAGAVLELREKI